MRLNREEMAALEVGQTTISHGLSASMVFLFVGLIVTVPLVQLFLDRHDGVPDLIVRINQMISVENGQTGQVSAFQTLWRRNNRLLARMGDFEEQLEKSSFLRRMLLSPGQQLLLKLGYGNEKVYPGKKGWLFYRPDMDYLIGQGFLDSSTLKERSQSGKIWEKPIEPDPVSAILDFNRQLNQRGIKLVLLPTPIKASLHPEFFAENSSWHLPLQNRSWQDFIDRMKEEGVDVFDAAPVLKQFLQQNDQPVYLATDTHWRPEAMEEVARRVALFLRGYISTDEKSMDYRRKSRRVTNVGDIAAMLQLTGPSRTADTEEVEIHPVVSRSDELWQPVTEAEVLLLGDSFSNIYSLSGMGWGEGSGFGEQVSFFLDRPVDLVSQNDAGAFATREMLAKEMARGRDRLAGKKVVVWQFASRELSSGNWKHIEMDLKKKQESGFFVPEPGESLHVKAVVAAVSRSPQPGAVPYKDNIITLHLVDVKGVSSGKEYGQALVYCWGMRDNKLTRFARVRAGQEIDIKLVDWDSVAEKYSSYRRSTLDDEMLELELPVWGEIRP